MTSIPASRRPWMTTFTPRSWPSRPGLAISTRMRRPGSISNHRRLDVGAEDPAHDRRHLPHRGAGLGRLDEGGQHVLPAPAGLVEAAEGPPRGGGLPPPLRLPQARELAREGGLVH